MRYVIIMVVAIVASILWPGPSAVAADVRSTAFALTDHTGRAVTDADFRGRFMLVFFGYTYCPDICPTELSVIADALDTLGDKAARVTPLFISVDPERDTPKAMAAYVPVFHERLVGLSGTKEQVVAAARNYGARYYKVYAAPFSDDADDSDDNSNYLISHSAASYLVGPDGTFLQEFPYGTAPDAMAAGIAAHLK